MCNSPYQSLLESMQMEARRLEAVPVRLGRVVSVAPLTVSTGGMSLMGKDLLVDARLMPREREVTAEAVKGVLDLSIPDGLDAEVTDGELTAQVLLPCELTAGDRVVLITADGQQFIVLCKVVTV